MLTETQCEEIVRNYHGRAIGIEEYELQPFSANGKGHLGEYAKLKINLKDCTKLDLFVKFKLGDPNQPQFVNLVTQKEVAFYNYLNRLDLDSTFRPACYYCCDEFIVMEDLSEENYKIATLPFDESHINLGLNALAKLHAASLLESNTSEDFMKEAFFSLDPDYIGNVYMKGVIGGLENLINSGWFFEKTEQFSDWFMEEIKKTLRIINTNDFIKVYSHGDLWMNNILYKYDDNDEPIDCKLIDFQLTRLAPPSHDVTTLILHNSDYKNIDKYLDYYYDKLKLELIKHGVDAETVLPKKEYDEANKIFINVANITKLIYSSMQAANKKRDSIKTKESLDSVMQSSNFILEMVALYSVINEKFKKELNGARKMFLMTHMSEKCCEELIGQKIQKDFKLLNYNIAYTIDDHHITHGCFKLETCIINNGQSERHLFFINNSQNQQEMIFFNSILPKFTSNLIFEAMPKYYQHDNALVFDYMENYDCINSRKPFSLDEVKIVVNTLVKLHAAGFIMQQNHQLDYLLLMDSNITKNLQFKNFTGTELDYKMDSSQFPKDDFKKFTDTLINNLKNLKLNPYPKTLCHGYLSHNNILMKYENDEAVDAKFINWNSFRLAPPSHDLYSFLYLTTLHSFRKYCMQDIVDYYCLKLREILLPHGLAMSDVIDSNDKAIAIPYVALHHQHALIDEKISAGRENCQNIENIFADSFNTDPIYRHRQNDMLHGMEELYKDNTLIL